MITTFAIIAMITIALLIANAVVLAVLGARAFIRHWQAMRALIEFSEHADQAIAVAALWSDEENEILLGRRPLQ